MHAYLFEGLRCGPRVIQRLIGMVPAESLDRPTHPDRFTPREVVAHLADWEPISRGRMKTALATPGAGVPDIDESQRAIDQSYTSWDPGEAAEAFVQRRAETIAWLEKLAPEDWKKTAVHSVKGEMSIDDYANMELGHDLYHIEQLCTAIGGAAR